MMMISVALVIAAYLLGSISSAIVVCRLMRLPDPRTQGSNNPGATNVLRIGGKKPAAITLVGDSLKGLIPMLLGHALGVGPLALAAIGLAAFLGHLYPLFFGFQGGKGVATALGVQFRAALVDWAGGGGDLAVCRQGAENFLTRGADFDDVSAGAGAGCCCWKLRRCGCWWECSW